MTVIKRDGSFAEFDVIKIQDAICKAMMASESKVNKNLAEKISFEIRKSLEENKEKLILLRLKKKYVKDLLNMVNLM